MTATNKAFTMGVIVGVVACHIYMRSQDAPKM